MNIPEQNKERDREKNPRVTIIIIKTENELRHDERKRGRRVKSGAWLITKCERSCRVTILQDDIVG